MTILNELINTCHGDLALFSGSVCEMITMLLSSGTVEYKSMGTEIVIIFYNFIINFLLR